MSKEKFDYFIKGEKGKYEVVIGLEVHAQVQSKSKLFSGSSTKFGADPNNQVSLIDSAFPGMLPVINEECVKQAVRTGLGLNAKINNFSVFDRKNYFYADLPQGYQISQYKNPIVGEGPSLWLLARARSAHRSNDLYRSAAAVLRCPLRQDYRESHLPKEPLRAPLAPARR